MIDTFGLPQVNLFFLVPGSQLGGCTSFTVHLANAFRSIGYDPVIYKVANVSKPRVTAFPYGMSAVTVSPEQAVAIARSAPSLIAYCFWAKNAEFAKALMVAGVPLVVHDPAEFHEDELAFMREHGCRPVVIRKANVLGLRKHGLTATYLPHPFVPSPPVGDPKRYHAVCAARVDFRKRTHTIIEANKLLRPEHQVHLYGEVNRMYDYHQLRGLHPDWRNWYHGEFPDRLGEAARLFSQARFAVDLTHIKGDGGGTQYTFFEAWSAGVPLVLNKAWATDGDDEVRSGDSCVMVSTAEELAGVLKTDEREFAGVVEGGRRLLKAHGPEVAEQYLEVMQ